MSKETTEAQLKMTERIQDVAEIPDLTAVNKVKVQKTETSNTSNADPSATTVSEGEEGGAVEEVHTIRRSIMTEENNPRLFPFKGNKLYNTSLALETLEMYPRLKIRGEGKYYLKLKDQLRDYHKPLKKDSQGVVIPVIRKESFGPIERIIAQFCEEVISISRSMFLPLSCQGERTLIWVGKKTATHIIHHLNGNGCYIVNRFPGDIFVKDKQVIGAVMKDNMLMRSNSCYYNCGIPKEDPLNLGPKLDESDFKMTSKICRHMVNSMDTDEDGCDNEKCSNHGKYCCEHLDIFIPEIQSFCTYNALQDFANRLDDDLQGQKFICKPAYLYKGLGQRVIRDSVEFKQFYHMTEGKETSRHDFMVQRMVDDPRLHEDRKFDIRAFVLVVVLKHRRVVAFVHYGFGRMAFMEYDDDDEGEEENDEEAEDDDDPAKVEAMIELKQKIQFEKDMRRIVCPWLTREEREDRKKRMLEGKLYDEKEDRSVTLERLFADEEERQNIKDQIKHVATKVVQAMENKIWENYGCFQLLGLDLCVNESNKVWLLEVNSHALSFIDTLSPTQRSIIPAVVMEAIGLVMECTYKTYHDLRLRKAPDDEFKETGFIFRQNFDFIFSTLKKKRKDYIPPPPKKMPEIPYYERMKIVDQQMKDVIRRKEACHRMKVAVKEEQLTLKRRREGKEEEES